MWCSCGGSDTDDDGDADALERAQARGYGSVAALAAAFAADSADPLRLTVVTQGAQDVAGGEPVVPARATVLGACAVLPHEHPHVICRTVDVRLPAARDERLADQLLAEVTANANEAEAALRGTARWVRSWEPAPVAEDAIGLREGGAYLFSGALTSAGWVLMEHLAATLGARLALVVDPALPERAAWDAHLAIRRVAPRHHGAHHRLAARRRRRSGVAPLLLRAPLDDADALRAAVERARDEFGALHGIVHAPALGEAGGYTPLAAAPAGHAVAELARLERELAALRAATDGRGAGLRPPAELRRPRLRRHRRGRGRRGVRAGGRLRPAGRGGGRRPLDQRGVGPLARERRRGRRGGGGDPSRGGRARLRAAGRAGRGAARGGHASATPRRRPRAPPPPRRARTGRSPCCTRARSCATSSIRPPARRKRRWRTCGRTCSASARSACATTSFSWAGTRSWRCSWSPGCATLFSVDLPLPAIFEAPTIAGLAELINEAILLELDGMSEEEALRELNGFHGSGGRGGEAAVSGSSSPHLLLATIDELSDEELDRLLAADAEDGAFE